MRGHVWSVASNSGQKSEEARRNGRFIAHSRLSSLSVTCMEEEYGALTERIGAARVTVVVPCYNAAPYLPAMFASLRAQTVGGFEVLLFDDGSSDGSADVAATFVEHWPGARVHRRRHNRGVCRTLNEAVQMVSTEFIIVFGADDVMLPSLVEDALAAIDRLSEEYAAVAFNHLVGDAEARIVSDERGEPKVVRADGDVEAAQPGELLPLLVVANRFASIALYRTEVVRTLGYDESLQMEDWYMWCRIAAGYRIGLVTWPLFVYRNTPDSLDKRLRVSGERQVEGAALRARYVGRTAAIDAAVTERTRVELHVLIAAGHREPALEVLRLLRAGGLDEKFRRERFLLRLPRWLIRLAVTNPRFVRRV